MTRIVRVACAGLAVGTFFVVGLVGCTKTNATASKPGDMPIPTYGSGNKMKTLTPQK